MLQKKGTDVPAFRKSFPAVSPEEELERLDLWDVHVLRSGARCAAPGKGPPSPSRCQHQRPKDRGRHRRQKTSPSSGAGDETPGATPEKRRGRLHSLRRWQTATDLAAVPRTRHHLSQQSRAWQSCGPWVRRTSRVPSLSCGSVALGTAASPPPRSSSRQHRGEEQLHGCRLSPTSTLCAVAWVLDKKPSGDTGVRLFRLRRLCGVWRLGG